MVVLKLKDEEFNLLIDTLYERRIDLCNMIEYDSYDMDRYEIKQSKKHIEELDLLECKFRRKRMGEGDQKIHIKKCNGCDLECELHNWC